MPQWSELPLQWRGLETFSFSSYVELRLLSFKAHIFITLTAMSNEKIFSRKINKETKLSIVSTDAELPENQPLFAINWFDLKSKWIYNFYNLLAAPLVMKSGARLVFKGFRSSKVSGSEEHGREALLVVYYPSPNHFLSLVERKYFQLISLFRVMSVKRFHFGFSEKLGGEKNSVSRNKRYAVHHFSNAYFNQPELDLLNSQSGVSVFFAARKKAVLRIETNNKETREAPLLINGIIIYEADTSETLEHFLTSEALKSFMARSESNYVARFGN